MTEVNQLVDKSTETIQTLSQRSEEIVKIVDVINEIAGQTNLLALNAAIEAARAGTHGRGFAVVADEIRKLADQTTSSTKGIEDMIANMQSETLVAVKAMKDSVIIVDEGMDVAHRASEVLGEVMDMSNHVSSAIEQLAATAQEQSSASTQINDNISSIASVTERAAQSANQMLSISEELNNQMVSLKQIESQFKL
jgi:methyl-accepting chemotaxis protein